MNFTYYSIRTGKFSIVNQDDFKFPAGKTKLYSLLTGIFVFFFCLTYFFFSFLYLFSILLPVIIIRYSVYFIFCIGNCFFSLFNVLLNTTAKIAIDKQKGIV